MADAPVTLARNARPALLLGKVMHRRERPAKNAFVYPVFYVQLPLRQLHQAESLLFGVDRPALLSLCSQDHGPRDGSPLLPWIEGLLQARGLPHDGEIVLQCFPRLLGYVFNPVSFWYCHDRHGALIAVLAEVNNTFGGTHSYLLHHPDGRPLAEGEEMRASKAFHVSPFCEVEGGYRFRFYRQRPADLVRLAYDDRQGEVLLTTLSGKRHGWGNRALLKAFITMPLMTFGVILRIHWQALKLWLKGVPFHGAHPTSPLQESPK